MKFKKTRKIGVSLISSSNTSISVKILFIILFMLTQTVQGILKKDISNYLNELADLNRSSGILTIQKGHELIFSQRFGNINSVHDQFKIGSISKSYTAVIVLKLIEEGKLKLSNKLSEFFPEIPNSEEISIDMLLSHSSGLVNHLQITPYYKWGEFHSIDSIIQSLSKATQEFQPGKFTKYSNSNYYLLSLIAENVSGKTLSQLYVEYIFNPLAFENTYEFKHDNFLDPISYKIVNGVWNPHRILLNKSLVKGGGGLVSSPEEISQFFYQLFTGHKLLKAKGSLLQFTQSTLNMTRSYGRGIYIKIFFLVQR